MPHTARIVSASGYYHIVPKGIADQLIFACDDDRAHYIELLGRAKKEFGFVLHAYCLMSNHTHLIVEAGFEQLSQGMKFVHERYGMRYSFETGRTGGVFRKPYWSEPIEYDEHLLCAVRYVHANPAAAGICAASTYDWSSAKDYLGRNGITDSAMVLDMCGGREGFISFSNSCNWTAQPFPHSKLRNHLTDDEALVLAKSILEMEPSKLGSLSEEEQRAGLALLRERSFTIAQLTRVTGISTKCVRRLLGI